MTPRRLKIGIIVPANNKAGPQKLAAVAAMDLCRRGHRVSLFIPRLPYYYYFVTLKKEPVRWARLIRHYVTDYVKHRSFSYQEILDDLPSATAARLSLVNVGRTPFRFQMSGFDVLIAMTIAQIVELGPLFPPEKTVYQIHHPEEIVHGHAALFRRIRKAFRGKIIAISPWSSLAVSGHIPPPPVVPDVISTVFWKQRFRETPGTRNRDILFHYSLGTHKGGEAGKRIIRAVLRKRPDTTITLWTRDTVPADMGYSAIISNLSEAALMTQYVSHKLLLFPSTMEGFGMPPVEAMACGCIPVVKAGVGAADLYARDNETTILTASDIDDTAAKIAALLDHADQMARMRTAAYRVLDAFDPNGYGLRILKAAGLEGI